MAHTTHHDELRQMLTARRRELQHQIQSSLRDARSEASGSARYGVESGDTTEVHPEDDLAFALIQLRAQVLTRIDEAMRRFDDGTYGYCGECGDAIAAPRLRALPFALRCKECEEMHERSERLERPHPRGEWALLELRRLR
jgi:DnaK suppressor protein